MAGPKKARGRARQGQPLTPPSPITISSDSDGETAPAQTPKLTFLDRWLQQSPRNQPPIAQPHPTPQSVRARHVETRPAQPQPVQPQPVRTQPASPRHIQAQPARALPIRTQPTQEQSAQAQSVRTQPIRTQHAQSHHGEAHRTVAPHVEPVHSNHHDDRRRRLTPEPPDEQSLVEPQLCPEQQNLIDLIVSGRNVFYTGSAGCGKSTVLKAAVKRLEDLNKNVYIVAPTGRAALQVNGMSTWSYMGWTPDFHKLPLEELIRKTFRKHIKKRLRSTHVLIIDEISMVENHHLERMNKCMQAIISWKEWRNGLPTPAFGGVQVILTGDFCQLPPVKPFQFCMECGEEMIPDGDDAEFNCLPNHGPFPDTAKWAFKSNAWREANFIHVNLKEIHRQKDEYFIKMLQKCRLGIPFTPKETSVLMNHPCDVREATKLFCTREEVKVVNQRNFERLTTPIYQYQSVDGFHMNPQHPHLAKFKNRLPDGSLVECEKQQLESTVTLRVGMLVVLQVNIHIPAGLVNGSQGIIVGFEPFDPEKLPKAKTKKTAHLPPYQLLGGEYADVMESQIWLFMLKHKNIRRMGWPKVRFHNGKTRTIFPSCVVNTFGDTKPYSLLHRTQIPLVAGWAISVHKSQGMTLERVIVDLSRAFEKGQVYVALSRATNLGGLKVQGDSRGLAVSGSNPEVYEFLQAKFGDQLLELARRAAPGASEYSYSEEYGSEEDAEIEDYGSGGDQYSGGEEYSESEREGDESGQGEAYSEEGEGYYDAGEYYDDT